MKKKISVLICLILFVSNINYIANAKDTTSDKLKNVNQKINQVKNNIIKGKKESKNLTAEIYSIEQKIGYTQNEINNLGNSIENTKSKIETSKRNLVEMEKNIEKQDENLKKRLRCMYKNGSVKFIEVLLGSENVTDFMTNMDMVERIHKQDQEVMKTLKKQHEVIEAEKKYLENLKIGLDQSRQNQARKQEELRLDQQTVKEKKEKLNDDIKSWERMRDQFMAEAKRLEQEILANQSKGTTYNGGKMAWPVPGWSRITSRYGPRTVGKRYDFHTGTDIDCDLGTPIVAANAGTVIKAAYNTRGYGYHVILDHGGGIATIYGHNSQLLVKVGDVVSRGQVIAKGGKTGWATGTHCHFEVRVNGKHVDPQKGWI